VWPPRLEVHLPRVPSSPDEITPEWLSRILESPVADIRVEEVGEGLGLSGRVFRVERDGVETLVVKLSCAAQGEREISFYRRLAPRLAASVPGFLAGAFDEERDRAALVLEDIAPARQGDVLAGCSGEEARGLARFLAELHSLEWGSAGLAELAWLVVPKSALGATGPVAPDRIRRFLERYRVSRELAQAVQRLPESLPGVEARLARETETLTHGDFHLDNVLFREGGGPVVLDWQTVGRGPAATDVARLLVECRTSEETGDDLIDLYFRELRARNVTGISAEGLRETVAAALLRLLAGTVGWLGAESSGGAEHPRVPLLKENLLEGLETVAARPWLRSP